MKPLTCLAMCHVCASAGNASFIMTHQHDVLRFCLTAAPGKFNVPQETGQDCVREGLMLLPCPVSVYKHGSTPQRR